MEILFISTHNFATNPRFVKEIDLALANKYKVTVVCFEFDNWSKDLNERIKQRLISKIKYYSIQASLNYFLPWLLSSFWFSFAKPGLFFFSQNNFLLSVRSNKRSWFLMKKLKELKGNFNLLIAHNPGSFYPASQLAKNLKIPLGIDLEDYHPGEVSGKSDIGHLKTLLKNQLHLATYLTAASPSIAERTKKDIGNLKKSVSVILNSFSENEFLLPEKQDREVLKIVWFSQNIGEGRGLEEVIPFFKKNNNAELHFYGNLKSDFFKQWLLNEKNIFIHGPLPQSALHQTLRLYDIGLALEKPGINLFRDLCITNKLIAYYQAGLYIIASNTIAQQKFIDDHPGHGIITTLQEKALFASINDAYAHRSLIRGAAKYRFERAKIYSWENESNKLLQIWQEVLN